MEIKKKSDRKNLNLKKEELKLNKKEDLFWGKAQLMKMKNNRQREWINLQS